MPDTRLEWVESDSGVPKLVEKQPEQNQGPPPPVDVIAKQRDKQAVKMLQEQLGKVEAEEGQKMGDELSAINNQFMLKQRAMRAKFDAERDPARKQSIQQQMMDIKTQFQGKMQGVKDKYAPTKRQVEQARASGMQQIQQAAQKRDFELQVLRRNAGNFKSDALVRQAEYKAMGIDVPLSQLEVTPDPEQRKASLVRDIGGLDASLKRFTPSKTTGYFDLALDKKAKYTDPLTGEERDLNPKDERDKAIIDQMHAMAKRREELRGQFQDLLMQEDPRYRQTVQDSEDRKKAKDIYMGNGDKGGGIKESLTNAVTKQGRPLDRDTATRILQQAGGDKTKARQIAKSQGYKL